MHKHNDRDKGTNLQPSAEATMKCDFPEVMDVL